jgi:hypothetical protein
MSKALEYAKDITVAIASKPDKFHPTEDITNFFKQVYEVISEIEKKEKNNL